MATIDQNTPPSAVGQAQTAPAESGPSAPELDALWNIIMANATSLYQESFSQVQEAEKDDDNEG
ncbi:hypothetical protein [Yoonia vestfoldensis]|uniref:hypothetical protein n=1 Tax=Yoonia vestfoldensis TaxID=245188 RepID=UPI00036363DA|nr:hypothetical protein [Yoonia vestfoldensis]